MTQAFAKPSKIAHAEVGIQAALNPLILSGRVTASRREESMRKLQLILLATLFVASAYAEDPNEDRWENIEKLKVGQKIEVTTTDMRTVQARMSPLQRQRFG